MVWMLTKKPLIDTKSKLVGTSGIELISIALISQDLGS